MVIKDDVSRHCLLEPCWAEDAAACADPLFRWFSVFCGSKRGVSTRNTHFLNPVISDMRRALGANHHFTTARCTWENVTAERLMRELCGASEAFVMNGDYNRPIGVVSSWLCSSF